MKLIGIALAIVTAIVVGQFIVHGFQALQGPLG